MDKKEIQKQCNSWNEKIQREYQSTKAHPKYLEHKIKIDNFTKDNLNKISSPKYKVFSIARQNVHNQEEYPIFFIKERQIFEENGKLEWRYFGSLFNIINSKVNYKTTTSFIPERNITEL
ncbi:MAG: hypothetical protein KJ646_00120 [Nanoarchaeota archaeon]|nr:hypothetical protein [Nanoarchaeota archaeon]MBU4116520.1 hypothetical protein [Nanoarchaeota archaeon]